MATESVAAAPAIYHFAVTDPELPSAMAPNYAGSAVPGRSSGNELAAKTKQQWPRTAPPASSEHIQSYFAQLSDIQQMLSQRATLAAQLGPSAAASAAKAPPASLAAAVQRLSALDSAMHPAGSASAHGAAAAELDGSSRKRRKHNAGQRTGSTAAAAAPFAGQAPDDFDTAAAVAGALFSSAAGDMLNSSANRDSAQLMRGGLQQFAAPAWCAVDVPGSSSYKGVQYLTAERRWQAYVVDHDITEVVWLGKYDTDWEAAQAHDRELIRRVGSTAAAPFVNFQSSLTSSGSSGSGSGSSGAMSLLPQPPALTVQDIRAPTAAAAAAAATTQPRSFSLAGNMSALQLPTLLPLSSLQEPATTTAAAAAAAFGSANFSSSFSMPVLDPPLPLSLAGPASTAGGDGFAQYSQMHSDGFGLYNSTNSNFPLLAGAERLSVPGVAAAPVQAVNFSASELSAQAAAAAPAAGGPGGQRYRIGRVQVTTAGPAAVAASTGQQWPPLMSAEQLVAAGGALGMGVAVAGGDSFAAGTAAQPGSMMALLTPTPPPAVAAGADAADVQGAGSSGGWMQQQPTAASTSAAGAMPGLGILPTPSPALLPLATAQQGSGGWAVPGGLPQLPAAAAAGHQGSGSTSSLVASLPASTVPLRNGGSYNTTTDMLPMSPHSCGAEHMPKISTTDVLIAAGGSSTGGCLGLPLSPTARTAAKASLPCSPVAAAAATATSPAAAASVHLNPISPINPESAAAWAASHIAVAKAAVPVSKYKGVEYLPAQQQWQAYLVEPALNEVVFLGTYDTELEAAHAHDREVMQRMGGAAAAAPQLNFVQAAAATTKTEAQTAAGAQPPQQQQQQQQKLNADSSALAALAEGPAMAAAMAAVANDSSHDRESIMHIAQAAAAAAAAAAGAAAAAAASLGDASKAGTRSRGSRAAAAGRGRRRRAAAAGGAPSAPKPVSQYKGVSWSASCGKWVAVIWDRVQRKARHLGVFGDEEAAAVAYDKEVVATQGAKNTGLNFRERLPTYQEELGIALPEATAGAAPDAAAAAAAGGGGSAAAGGKGAARSSSYRGISWHDRSKRWEARAWGAGRQHFVGSFLDQEEAARAYDRAILKLGGSGHKSASRLNFPLADYDLSEIEAMELPAPGTGHTGKAPSTRRPAKRARNVDDYDSEDDEE